MNWNPLTWFKKKEKPAEVIVEPETNPYGIFVEVIFEGGFGQITVCDVPDERPPFAPFVYIPDGNFKTAEMELIGARFDWGKMNASIKACFDAGDKEKILTWKSFKEMWA